MNQLSQKELEQIISLYIDGELDQTEKKRLESYLETHPAVAREVEILRMTKHSLGEKPTLPKNDWFWLKLSNRLEQSQSRTSAFSLSKNPAYAIASLAVLTVFVIGVIFVKEAPLFKRFFMEKKVQAENIYRNNIMTGNILPLFSNLNKDDVLNFALFGTISIDSSRNTSLQVKNTDAKGSQIQIVRNDELPKPDVTVDEFAAQIGISADQREVVDSILGSYKEKLQSAVLVSENDEVAIHAGLVDLNRAMVSTIASCLEPPQRSRFQRFLDKRNAPYAVVAVNSPTVPSHIILNKIPRTSNGKNYVVISPGAIEIAEMTINMDSIRDVARRQEMHYRKLITERMVAELTERQRRVEENLVGMGQNRVSVQSSSGAFQINFERPAPAEMTGFESVEMVRPRMPGAGRENYNQLVVSGDSILSFEFPSSDQTMRVFKRLPRGEFHYEVSDTTARGTTKMRLMFKSSSRKHEFESKLREMKEREQDLIDLDSLLRESDSQPEQQPSKPKKSGKEIELEIMM
ncbi:MAG: anti-sigma factor family protein [Bacteroidota bacterium]